MAFGPLRRSTYEDGNRRIRTDHYYVACSELPGASGVIDEVLTFLPDLFDTHAEDSTLHVVNRRVRTDGSEFHCEVVYEEVSTLESTGLPVIRFGVVEEETNQDKNGTYMAVSYIGVVNNFFPSEFGFVSGTIDGTRALTALVARPVFSFDLIKRYTGASALATVLGHGQTYRGTINSATWTGTINLAARTCLCTAVEPEVRSSTEVIATFSFEYRETGWDFDGVFKLYNRAPANLSTSTGNGRATYEMYDEQNFNTLGIHL